MEMPMEAARDGSSRSPQQSSRPSRPPPPRSVPAVITVATLQECHDNAYKLIEQGLSSDEQGKPDEAKAFYDSGMKAVEHALKINCESILGTNDEKDKAKMIQQKLNKTKLQIEYRLQALRASEIATPSAPQSMDVEFPPSYEYATSLDAQYASLGDSIMAGESTEGQSLTANATEIFSIPEGVQIFFISPEGNVSAPSYPSALKVFKFTEQPASGANNVVQPAAFLQVGDWVYPLQPCASTAMRTQYGAYIFPDVQATVLGAAVGLMIPDTVPQGERQCFEDLLQNLTMMHQQQEVEATPTETTETGEVTPGEAETTSTKISKGLIVAAEYISWGMGKGAEKASELISAGSSKLRARLRPEQSPRPIDPRVQTGIQYVRKGSHAAVQVSSYLVTKLGQATMYLAKEAAPHIRRQGGKYMPKSLKEEKKEGKSTIDSVLEVAASGLHGFGTVYMGLEQAAKALGKSLANETVQVVTHKYGPEAGHLTENTLYSAGNLALTAHNANNFGVKAVAKRAAKDTGKAILMDHEVQHKQTQKTDNPPNTPVDR
ncbi:spartin-like [Mya arenaria]|uniref:spartin-like n=1 Tax=Mya arenaria TaxID=6604 RepID=UPI0022E90C46|nr:spartin-like [Mya arenaria]